MRYQPKRFRSLFVSPISKRYFEGDEGGDDGGGSGEGGDGGGSNEPKTFYQEDVDRIVQTRLAKQKKEAETLSAQLEQIKTNQNLTQEERDNLQQQLDTLNNSYLTEQEQAAKKLKAEQEKANSRIKGVESERDQWQQRFSSAAINRALTDAAVETDAESPEQIQMMFGGLTRLEEEKSEDGKPTGNFTPFLKFKGKDPDEEGKLKEFDMPVGEALKQIKKDGLFANLFKHGGKSGTGREPGGQSTGGGAHQMKSLEDFGGNAQKYSEWWHEFRKTHDADGNPL